MYLRKLHLTFAITIATEKCQITNLRILNERRKKYRKKKERK